MQRLNYHKQQSPSQGKHTVGEKNSPSFTGIFQSHNLHISIGYRNRK